MLVCVGTGNLEFDQTLCVRYFYEWIWGRVDI